MEEKNMNQQQQYSMLNIIAAISVSGLIYLGNFVSPVISSISATYPDVSESTIKMLTTIPSLMMVIMSLVSGGLTSRYPIKKIVVFASFFSLVGGVMPVPGRLRVPDCIPCDLWYWPRLDFPHGLRHCQSAVYRQAA